MAIRVKTKSLVRIFEDTAEKNGLFTPDDTLAEEIVDTFERCASGRFNIAAAGTEALSFGDVDDVRGVFIRANGAFNFTMNGGVEVFAATLLSSATTSKARVLMQATLTALSITNPGAAALTGVWAVWGDPTP